jgi:hypothetical protein
MALTNAERQRRYRERAAAALRNSRVASASTASPTSTAPLRLLVPIVDDDGDINYDHYSEQEHDAAEVMDRVCRRPSRGRETSTSHADMLIRLLESDPAAFTDYAKRFVTARVAEYAPKPKKRSKAAY